MLEVRPEGGGDEEEEKEEGGLPCLERWRGGYFGFGLRDSGRAMGRRSGYEAAGEKGERRYAQWRDGACCCEAIAQEKLHQWFIIQ